MAGAFKDCSLSKEEEDILLNQSNSDVEYEDAIDELRAEEALSKELQEKVTLQKDCTEQHSQDCNEPEKTVSKSDISKPTCDKDNEKFSDAESGIKSELVDAASKETNGKEASKSCSESDSDEDEDDFVEAAMKDAESESAEDGAEKPAEDEPAIDEELLREKEDAMTEEEKEAKKSEGQALKAQGNEFFREQSYEAALEAYTDALMACPLCYPKERSIMYSNRAACKYKLEKYESAVTDCSKALELNPAYLKALLRRAELYEKTEKLDEALEDYQKVLEMDPSIHQARAACLRLPDQIKERNEKMKEEMLGKLKDLGNMILKPFGLSTNNFQLQQDPNTGGYSVNFQQNTNNG